MSLPAAVRGDTGLAGRLREATRDAHRRAEGSPFVARLLAGALPLTSFAALVANHHAIYDALEDVPPGWCTDPVAGPFACWPGLARGAALRADLAALDVTDPAALVAAATRRYADRVRTLVAAGRADLWLAHHYVRYLGDVSGGQVVARAVREVYGAQGAAAVSFYGFGAVGPVPRFRARYRAALDAAPVDDVAAVVAEAVDAFDRNREVFDALPVV